MMNEKKILRKTEMSERVCNMFYDGQINLEEVGSLVASNVLTTLDIFRIYIFIGIITRNIRRKNE